MLFNAATIASRMHGMYKVATCRGPKRLKRCLKELEGEKAQKGGIFNTLAGPLSKTLGLQEIKTLMLSSLDFLPLV